jgi:hypothetical protein
MMKTAHDIEIGLPTIVDPAEWQKAFPYTWWRRHDEFGNDFGGSHA